MAERIPCTVSDGVDGQAPFVHGVLSTASSHQVAALLYILPIMIVSTAGKTLLDR